MDQFANVLTWKGFDKIFTLLQKKVNTTGMCCVAFQEDGIAIAYIDHTSTAVPVLKNCAFLAASPANYAKTLSDYVKEQELSGSICSLILQSGEYYVHHIDPPQLPPEELLAGLRWKIKDMLNFPASTAVIDYFPAPESTPAAKTGMINVVAADSAHIKKLINIIKVAGLSLQTIDIAELALRNLLALYPGEQTGVGLLWLRPSYIELTICKQKNLFLNRVLAQINTDWLHTSNSAALLARQNEMEDIILKIQRSLDYYQSQLRQPSLGKLLVTSLQDEVSDYLSDKLTVETVERFNLETMIKCEQNFPATLYANCLAVIGGALRKEEMHAAAS